MVDYGVGNVGSIIRMAESAGMRVNASADWRDIKKAKKLILPGVGNFGHAMGVLRAGNLDREIVALSDNQNVPLLGICLGMQLLGNRSEESSLTGLGIIDAEVVQLTVAKTKGRPVPHMGWNVVEARENNDLIDTGAPSPRFYFAHSYVVVPKDPRIALATAVYGSTLCVAIQDKNVYGVQFHPEKSHRFGRTLFERFSRL